MKKIIIKKEELKKMYIDEGKTIQRISKNYNCSSGIVKRKLKEYDIPIRLNGAFLVDENNKSLNSKRLTDKISNSEYYNERAKSKGFKDKADYNQKMNFKNGMGTGLSMYDNKNSPKYLGIIIAERILPKIFNNVKMMQQNNHGFDAICNRNLKIEVKCSSLHKNNQWVFHIRKNKIADYFFIVGFDNRDNLSVMHIWLIKNDAVIENTNQYSSEEFILNEKEIVNISKGKSGLKRWEKYEKTDYLDEAQKICDEFKMKEININK